VSRMANTRAAGRSIGLLLILGLAAGYSDNATKLSYAIKSAAETSRIDGDSRTQSFSYVPKSNPDLPHLSVGNAPFLVVVQEGGGLNFTTHWHQFASVPEVLCLYRRKRSVVPIETGQQSERSDAAVSSV
jgi:hypothetical protein